MEYNRDMARDHVEVGATYSVPPEMALPSLDDLAGVATVDPPVIQELLADYFDTDDLRLARLGITLRRRSGGEDSGWHLKVPVAGARHEVHEPYTVDLAPPAPLLDALQGVVRGGALSPQVTIRTSREVRRLRDVEGSVLAEVVDDHVHAERWTSGDRATTWREWEIELVQGDVALLNRVSGRVETAGAQAAAHASQLARALGECGVAVGAAGADDGTPTLAREIVWARLRDLEARLLRWDVLVRRDAEDSVHQVRVTVRRLRSALATFRPMFDRDRTEPLRAELRWLGLLLGDARDAEVLRDRIGDLAGGEDPRLLDRGSITSAHEMLARRYRDNHDRLVREMRSPRYAALVDSLEHLVAEPPFAPGDVDREAGALRTHVRHDWKRLASAVDRTEQVLDVGTRQHRLHEVRKAAKRTRYAAEPLIPIYGPDAEGFVMAVEEIQESLGDLNDALISLHELQRLALDESARGHDTSTLDLLRTREQEAADASEARFTKAWHQARRRKVLRWLG